MAGRRPGPKKHEDPDTTIPEVVDRLFRTYRHPEGREYYFREVAEAINAQYLHLLRGAPIDPTHLSKIRSGDIRDPSRRVILALCAFFRVPVATFFPELEQDAAHAARADQLEGLPPQLRTHIEGLIREFQQLRTAHAEPEAGE